MPLTSAAKKALDALSISLKKVSAYVKAAQSKDNPVEAAEAIESIAGEADHISRLTAQLKGTKELVMSDVDVKGLARRAGIKSVSLADVPAVVKTLFPEFVDAIMKSPDVVKNVKSMRAGKTKKGQDYLLVVGTDGEEWPILDASDLRMFIRNKGKSL